jgi:hypothetical protein
MRVPFLNLRIMPFGIRSALTNRKNLILALTWRRLFNREKRVFANSLPKSGTHLLNRCLSLMPGMAYAGQHLNVKKNVNAKEHILKRLGGGCIVTAHLPFSIDEWTKLQSMGYKQVLMIRDPRDVIVSQFHFIKKRSVARLYSYFAKLPDDEARIMAAIQGVPDHESPYGIGFPDIGTRFNQYLDWGKHGSHVVRFENLVGETGGGSAELQLAEVEALSKYVGIALSSSEVEEIAGQVFSRDSKTFRKGEIGDWRNYLSEAHKRALKELIGQLLIELGYECNLDW